MNHSFKIPVIVFLLISSTLYLTSCKKKDTIPTLTTVSVSGITQTSAVSGGYVTSDGGAEVTARGVCWGISHNPIVSSDKMEDGTGNGRFTSNLAGLTANITYYVRAYATNSEGTGYGNEWILKTFTGTVTDIDLNVYNTVTIGSQVWMAENLKTTKYDDGTPIPNVTDNTTWAALTTGAYSDYSNTPSNSTTYGRLYNWYAVDNNAATNVASNGGKNVCPTSWHMPTNVERITLTNYLGGESVAGGKLKETVINIGQHLIQVRPTKRVLQVFRVATVTTMEHATMLESPVYGGVLRRFQQQPPGTGPWTIIAPMPTDTTTISIMAFLFAV